jgi:hypothetical protein
MSHFSVLLTLIFRLFLSSPAALQLLLPVAGEDAAANGQHDSVCSLEVRESLPKATKLPLRS